MSCEVILTDDFKKDAKKLAKKYPSLSQDLKVLIAEIEKNPDLGIKISEGVYKIRFTIKSKVRAGADE